MITEPKSITPHQSIKNTLAFTIPLLNEAEAAELILSSGQLGSDPSSKYFTPRTKNIAYVICLQGQWFQIRANYFLQSEQYNDFSGGYKRYYQELPEDFLASNATKKVLNNFKSTYNIPDNEPILVQVQKSHITIDNVGQCLTGQGIHSDGAEYAILVCLERNNVRGAKNAVYRDLEGEKPVLNPFILKEGEGMLWHDNEVFHHVEPAQPLDNNKDSSRTVLIAHYPATHYLTGTLNPNNTLGTRIVDKSQRLRNQI